MWLAAANVGFTGTGAFLYWIARRRLLVQDRVTGRNQELLACALVSLLAVAGFGLAHVGMNYGWTGRVVVTDLQWLSYALISAGLLFAAHALLRLQRSRADQLVLPVAAFLAVLGLVNTYAWETRDANAYISTVALPALRDYRESIAESRSLSPSQKAEILRTLRPVPNELDYERGSRGGFATVLDAGWLEAYNASARSFEAARAAHPGQVPSLPVREVRLYDGLRKQLLAAGLGFLLVPLVLFAISRAPLARLAGTRLPVLGAGSLLLAIVGAALLTSGDRSLPALLRLGGHSLTVYELLKLGLVVVLALSLADASEGGREARFGLAAAGLTIAAVVWRDTGAGIALLAVAVLMTTLVADRRWRYSLVVAGALALAAAPAAVRSLDSHLPQTVRVRIGMWTDPWGAYQRAAVENDVTRALARIVGYRRTERVAAAGPDGRTLLASQRLSVPAPQIEHDANEIEQELRWRLDGLQSRASRATPLIPGADPVEKLLLLEAESLWSDLGGSRPATASRDGMLSFRARVHDAIGRLQAGADRVGAELLERDRSHAGAQSGPNRLGADPGALAPDNFQLQRSLFALRKGGAFGVGLGLGRPEAVPGLTEDVALASLGEALGLAGVLLVALLLLLLTGRAIELAQRQSQPVLALLAVGLSALVGLQALIGIGGISGLLPFTGLTFPFVSRSGTALVTNFLALALVMAIAARSVGERAPRGRSPRLLRSAGFPAAFALVLSSVALLQLTGRTLTPGPILAALPGPGAPFLHARDQWNAPSYRMAPGPIVDRDGLALAKTTSLGRSRVYPNPRLATSLGHTLLQLDLAFHDELVRPERSRRLVGPTLVTTIDSGVQRAVHEAFDQGSLEAGLPNVRTLRGAVVVVDVKDGGIVALESRPGFSLAELADPVAWAGAEAKERRSGFPYRYLNRVVHGFYPPGSIFKTVTAAAVLERGFHSLHSRDFDFRHGPESRRAPDGVQQLGAWHELPLRDGPPITDGNHPQLDTWLFDLQDAYAWSCNVAFARMGLEVGPADLIGFARRFGFERPLHVAGLGTATSTLDNDSGKDFGSRYLAESASNLARTAFGQGQARVTPLQMSLVPAGIANGGTIMQPHIVAGWKSEDGTWLRRYRPRVFADTRLSKLTVRDLQEMMRASVTYGWARTARVNPNNANPGVAGKTGSAEWSEKRDASHAWFIGYLPTEAPRLALAVVVERGGSGPTVAGRIARRIFAADAVQRYVREASGR